MIPVAGRVSITVACDACSAKSTVEPADVRLVQLAGVATYYSTRCPACSEQITKRTATGAELRAVGVQVVAVVPAQRTDAPPLTEDDLISFGRELERTPNGRRA